MSKFVLLGDLHFGVKKDDEWTERYMLEFVKWFISECKRMDIRYCLQAGDWFDVRQGISQRTLQFMREDIIPLFQDAFDEVHVIVGNHDMKHKELITPNSCKEVLGKVDKFHVIETPETIMVGGGVCVDMIPWICKSNEESIMQFIKKSKSPYCIGHFELNNFDFYKGIKARGGMESDFLEKYKHVWSGHYHTISNGGNVQYLGTPYTITLGDANDPRGFWVYDSDETQIDFHQNPVTNHHKVYFDASTWNQTEEDLIKLYGDKTVKLIIEQSQCENNKTVKLDRVLDSFEKICHEFSFEYVEKLFSDDSSGEDVDIVSTFAIIEEQISILEETDLVKQRIRNIFNGLYTEAASTK